MLAYYINGIAKYCQYHMCMYIGRTNSKTGRNVVELRNWLVKKRFLQGVESFWDGWSKNDCLVYIQHWNKKIIIIPDAQILIKEMELYNLLE